MGFGPKKSELPGSEAASSGGYALRRRAAPEQDRGGRRALGCSAGAALRRNERLASPSRMISGNSYAPREGTMLIEARGRGPEIKGQPVPSHDTERQIFSIAPAPRRRFAGGKATFRAKYGISDKKGARSIVNLERAAGAHGLSNSPASIKSMALDTTAQFMLWEQSLLD